MSDIYHLELTVAACHVVGLINGFPAFDLDSVQSVSFSPPINPFLVKGSNAVLIQVAPIAQRDARLADPSEVVARGGIRRYRPGETVQPGGGDLIVPIRFRPSSTVDAWQMDLPHAFSLSFEAATESFRDRLLEAPPLQDAARATGYAIALRDALRARDVDAMVEHFSPKRLDYARAYGRDPAKLEGQLRSFLTTLLFPLGPRLDFEADDVRCTSWCGGRIWHLALADGPLIRTGQDAQGGRYAMDIFAGVVGDELRVVR